MFSGITGRRFLWFGRICPAYVGMHDGQLPWANVGRMRSTGMDGTASYSQEIGEVTLTARGNFTFSRTKVLEYDEAVNALDYQKTRDIVGDRPRDYRLSVCLKMNAISPIVPDRLSEMCFPVISNIRMSMGMV